MKTRHYIFKAGELIFKGESENCYRHPEITLICVGDKLSKEHIRDLFNLTDEDKITAYTALGWIPGEGWREIGKCTYYVNEEEDPNT